MTGKTQQETEVPTETGISDTDRNLGGGRKAGVCQFVNHPRNYLHRREREREIRVSDIMHDADPVYL